MNFNTSVGNRNYDSNHKNDNDNSNHSNNYVDSELKFPPMPPVSYDIFLPICPM